MFARTLTAIISILLVACAADPPSAGPASEALQTDPAAATLAFFEGRFDPVTNELSLEVIDVGAGANIIRQHLGFCADLLVGPGGLTLESVPGSIALTLEECVPSAEERAA